MLIDREKLKKEKEEAFKTKELRLRYANMSKDLTKALVEGLDLKKAARTDSEAEAAKAMLMKSVISVLTFLRDEIGEEHYKLMRTRIRPDLLDEIDKGGGIH